MKYIPGVLHFNQIPNSEKCLDLITNTHGKFLTRQSDNLANVSNFNFIERGIVMFSCQLPLKDYAAIIKRL